MSPMRRLFLALSLSIFALPAQAATELSFPLGYETFMYSSQGENRKASGLSMPLFWFAGNGQHLTLDSNLGYLYLQTPAEKGHFFNFENDLSFRLPVGFVTPSIGLHGSLWAPIQAPQGLGWMGGVAPMVGLMVDLGLFILEAKASQGPMWGLNGSPSKADLTRVEGRITFGF